MNVSGNSGRSKVLPRKQAPCELWGLSLMSHRRARFGGSSLTYPWDYFPTQYLVLRSCWKGSSSESEQTAYHLRCGHVYTLCLPGLTATGRLGSGLIGALRFWWQSKAASENSGIWCLQGSVLCRMPEGRIKVLRP